MTFMMKGLNEIQNKLKDLERKAKELDGSPIPLTNALTPEFIREYSSFSSLDELLQASGFKVESQEDFDAIPDDEWDKFIGEHTRYSSWQEMLNEAGARYAKKKLGL